MGDRTLELFNKVGYFTIGGGYISARSRYRCFDNMLITVIEGQLLPDK